MRKLALGLATAAVLGFAAPALATDNAAAPDRIRLAQADVTVKSKVMPSRSMKKKIVIKQRKKAVFAAQPARKKVIIKRGPHVKKKVIIER
jgi:hypothetical protein